MRKIWISMAKSLENCNHRPDCTVCSRGLGAIIERTGRMGSIRTWSLAVVAGIFVVVVAHQRSDCRCRAAARRHRPAAGRQPAATGGGARIQWPRGRPGHRAAGFLRRWSPRTARPWSTSAWSKSRRNSAARAMRATTIRCRSSSIASRCRVPSTCRRATASGPDSSSRRTATCSPTRTWWRMPRR